jgi:2-oxoglutarate dehydrogenase E2 component (dihydrolipoamide succinyltransferase)
MAIELKIPSAGESITEVVVVEWLKGEGAIANRDEALALVETDKANVEVLAPARGKVARILKKAGETAKVGEVIGILEPAEDVPSSGAHAPATTTPKPAVPAPQPQKPRERDGEKPEAPRAREAAPLAEASLSRPAPATPPIAHSPEPAGVRLTPATRRALREAGSGAPGRQELRSPSPPSTPAGDRREEVIPMTPLRRRVAERLVEANQTAALLTTFNEIDMGAVIALRKQYQDAFKEKHGTKLGFMSFFVRASIEALKAFPAINAEIRGNDIVHHHYCDIGVAVGGGKGLVVPIIRNAERLGFGEIERVIADFGQRAKDGRLKVDELQGGTFTISNGGIYGSMMSTPIVNPPQSGILGMHAIQERPVVRSGQIVVAPMMYVALTYDHRIVDGREAVGFLVRVKECVENPARLLLEV